MDAPQVTRPELTEAGHLREWLKGDEDAVQLMLGLFNASQLADDLVDETATRAQRRAWSCELLILTLVTLPANPAYRRWQGWLAPMIADAVLAWDHATYLEGDTEETGLAFAFAWRDQLERIIVHLALLIGGLEHARMVQEQAWRYFRFEHDDGQTWTAWNLERVAA